MNVSSPTELFDPDDCLYQPQIFLEWKMIFVGMIGLITAVVSIFHNSLLFYTFTTSKVLKKRNLIYLRWISGCDVFISVCYIAIMCVQVYTDFFESFSLLVLWHRYLRVAFTVSHITLSTSSFLLMAATIERYLQSTADNRAFHLFKLLSTHRGVVVLLCFLMSCIFRGTVLFEVEVVYNKYCTGLSSLGLATLKLFSNPIVDVIWKFWMRKIVTVFLPFVVLASFNAAIVLNVRRTDRDQTVKALVLFITVGTRGEATRLRSRLRAVTRMLVMVVSCYLIANILDVIIAFWETIDIESITERPGLYAVMADISSFLPILATALRLPIYATNDKQIRKEVSRKFQSILSNLCYCKMKESKKCYEMELDSAGFLLHKQTESPELEMNQRGVTTLIMARASISNRELFDIKAFQEHHMFRDC